MKQDSEQGLGDKVERVIETIAPNLARAARKRGCNCKKRKEWLNNKGAIFK